LYVPITTLTSSKVYSVSSARAVEIVSLLGRIDIDGVVGGRLVAGRRE